MSLHSPSVKTGEARAVRILLTLLFDLKLFVKSVLRCQAQAQRHRKP